MEYLVEKMKITRPPIHPGIIVAEDIMPDLRKKRTIGEIARLLDVSRQHLYKILAGNASISPDFAARLGKLVGNGAGLWLRMQADYDTWEAEHRLSGELKRIPTQIAPS
jgi:addiction module HigA family antidote